MAVGVDTHVLKTLSIIDLKRVPATTVGPMDRITTVQSPIKSRIKNKFFVSLTHAVIYRPSVRICIGSHGLNTTFLFESWKELIALVQSAMLGAASLGSQVTQ